jgi:hypothetical protein
MIKYQKSPHRSIRKRDLVRKVVLGERENNIGAVLFHQAVGQILGVNLTDMKCLDIITLQGSASPTQLAALTGLSTGATTAMIHRLEKRALIVPPTLARSTGAGRCAYRSRQKDAAEVVRIAGRGEAAGGVELYGRRARSAR